jgi:hypothetical protein
MTLPVIPTIKSITDLRYQTAQIMEIIEQNKPVVITRDKDTVAIMLSPILYDHIVTLMQEIEDKKDAQTLEKEMQKGGAFVDFTRYDQKQRKKFKLD